MAEGMHTQPTYSTRTILSLCLLSLALVGGACDQGNEPPPDTGFQSTPSDVGGGLALTLPSDDKCLDDSLTADEAQALCQWGGGVLGPQGTVFQAACIDVVYDAGATGVPAHAMTNMVVLSQATCLAKIRTAYSGCPYTVGQFKASVDGFHAGDCSGASLNILVGYQVGTAP
jgi:hypothetical protein